MKYNQKAVMNIDDKRFMINHLKDHIYRNICRNNV